MPEFRSEGEQASQIVRGGPVKALPLADCRTLLALGAFMAESRFEKIITMKGIACFKLLACFCVAACLTAVVGCATTKPVDWASRVGNYTYNQAVVDLGPPDKQTTLDDGRTVAEWITRSSGSGFSIGTGFSSGNAGVGVGRSSDSTRNHVIRLTFGSNGLLETWFKN